MDPEELEPCPKCGQRFPILEIFTHVEACGDRPVAESDEELARRLQAEEEAAHGGAAAGTPPPGAAPGIASSPVAVRTVNCQICHKLAPVTDMYILDECSHKFCPTCIKAFVARTVVSEVTCCCPVDGCKAPLSVQDMTNLLPAKPRDARTVPTPESSAVMRPGRASVDGSRRLMKELAHIKEVAPSQKLGIDANPKDDNLYCWEISITGFDEATEPIAVDMRRMRVPAIILQATFPATYPHSPPFIRVLRPRFQFRTGHVTAGGSICMEMLTAQGWTPSINMLSVLISIRAAFIEGGARLDPSGRGVDYDEREAIEAFHRLLQVHKWR